MAYHTDIAWFTVVTNYRTFKVEAAGIGAAIDSALNLILDHEYLRKVTA